MSDLPDGWTIIPIDAVTTKPLQGVPEEDRVFLYLDIGSIDREAKKIISPEKMSGKVAPSRARQIVRAGDVLVSMTRPNLNAVALVKHEHNEQIASTGFDVLRAVEIDPRWLFALVRTKGFVDAMSNLVQGALYPAVRPRDIRSHEIPLAPLSEQKRVADKIEMLLARVDTMRERLNSIPIIMKRFRQSVLAAAASGVLTAEWRGRNTCKVKSDLELILKDRALNFRKKRPPQPHREDEVFVIPSTWLWVSLDSLSSQIVDGTHHTPTYLVSGIPFISVKDIRNGLIHFSDTKYISEDEHKELLKRCHPEIGDLLITKSGTIGRTAIVKDSRDFSLFVSVALIKPASELVNIQFVDYALQNWLNRIDISSRIVGTAVKNLHLVDMRVLAIPFPSLDEQKEIVRRVERLFLLADEVESRYNTARVHADKLVHAILAKAFRGELVPQDPSDEPTSELLKRIRTFQDDLSKLQKPKKNINRISKVKKAEASMLDRDDITDNHLTKILKKRGVLTAEALWSESELDIDAFYDQLKFEEMKGFLKEQRVNDETGSRLLEAAA